MRCIISDFSKRTEKPNEDETKGFANNYLQNTDFLLLIFKEEKMKYGINIAHENLLRERVPELKFDETADYAAWKEKVREKFFELLGDMPERVVLEAKVEFERECEEYVERRIIFRAERDCLVPCHLLIPKKGKAPYPTLICLQGHSSGMHISLGRMQTPRDEMFTHGDEDYAMQALKLGYAVIALEQRSFGERRCDPRILDKDVTCAHDAMVALLLGRTMIGCRAFDVSRTVDLIEEIPELDSDRIALMGLSGGGTATYYAAAFEPRIKAAMPAGAVCSFDGSIGTIHHCSCNYIPGIAKYFDMGEIAALIAPRPLVVVTGSKDDIFLLDGVRRVDEVITKIYEKENAVDKHKLIVGDGGHRFYAADSWDSFTALFPVNADGK